jgi:hypothetical protein
MTVVAQTRSYVIEVATHARNHVLAVLATTGQLIDTASFPTTRAGMARAVDWFTAAPAATSTPCG